jgi:hypothetical protein
MENNTEQFVYILSITHGINDHKNNGDLAYTDIYVYNTWELCEDKLRLILISDIEKEYEFIYSSQKFKELNNKGLFIEEENEEKQDTIKFNYDDHSIKDLDIDEWYELVAPGEYISHRWTWEIIRMTVKDKL